MAPVSCRDLHLQLPALARSATSHTQAQLSFLRAGVAAPCRTLTTTRSTRADDVVHLEHDVAQQHAKHRRDYVEDEEEEEDRYLPDDAHRDELASRWREIHGRDDWAGLLDPMDPLLRSELIRYGELAQACYDAFDYDPSSRYCGSCKHPRRDLLDRLGMPSAARGYTVSRYLYATSNFRFPAAIFPQSRAGAKIWSQRANWIGYVAVSTDEESARLGRRDVAIAWRGTVTRLEWVSDLMDFLRPVADEGLPCPDPEVKVLSGFVDLYTDKDPTCRFCKYSAREQVLAEVRRLVSRYAVARGEDVSITVTGHSLGSALAMLSAYDIAESGANRGDYDDGIVEAPVCVYSFAGPRVGNAAFKRRFEDDLGVKALRVVNVHDNVPRMPGILVNEGAPEVVRRVAEGLLRVPWCYAHVGVELPLDHKRSPFLKDTLDPACYHDLEAHLHLLDGYHGRGERFVLASGRDPALVNKACDFLKDHHGVPPCWRQDENKGMVRGPDGSLRIVK
ncbi:hypothetical protein QOZ80_5AG0374630 [Eleusine coracana subsp. coracana]|nr:hypothetical protein QOZ80_5AG0374630 [Eleusine coracana subsp. coracana]